MREQGSTGWGLTVSQRFESRQQADQAAQQLRQAGFREEDIRIWQHKKLALSVEDRLARTVEGILAGGVISGLAGFFLTAAISWAQDETIRMQTAVGVTVPAAIIGALVTAVLVNIISTRVSFNPGHGHAAPSEPPSVVTVTVRDKEADARRVFQGARATGH